MVRQMNAQPQKLHADGVEKLDITQESADQRRREKMRKIQERLIPCKDTSVI